MSDFENRQAWDLGAWPEMFEKAKELLAMIFSGPPDIQTNRMVFTIASLTAGCRHCQAHGAYGLDKAGVELAKIQALWTFESSELFTDRERAALRFGVAAASVPNSVTSEHHRDLRAHFSDVEVRTLIGVVSVAGFMNRYNDSLATVTDAASADWAAEHLASVGWDIGKHVGAPHEQRADPPGS